MEEIKVETYVEKGIASSPRFRELVKKRTRLTLALTSAVLAVYYAFILMVSFRPDILRTPLATDVVTSVGWPLGAFVIVFSWLLTGCYVYRANGEFDRLSAEILGEVKA
ncbi:DUF485 domain-containing protein [Cupriavidus sp. 2SB]|uniref:DUF485 domain-containing protein n=1 Tax=Cupriavidus sp. 2SB TaxID=2502199 RepID=UPI001BB2905C|nr:DUF485 domain-containing protein [Cupriavidus sp. 2SB]